MIIMLDMDGVVTDWIGGVCNLLGVPLDKLSLLWPPGKYDIELALSAYFEREFTEDELWDRINHAEKFEGFWRHLEMLPWAQQLLDLVEDMGSEWYYCTSPSRHASSFSGKRLWMQRHHGDKFRDYFLTKHKHLLANPVTVLIDDSKSKIKKFKKHGGHTILFPRFYNGAKEQDCDDPISYVEAEMARICDEITG